MFLIDHLPGCTPVSPCPSCEGARLLRSKLSTKELESLGQMMSKFLPEELEEFGRIMWRVKKSDPPYGHSNPVPLDASVNVLDISARGANCLNGNRVESIGHLTELTEIEIMKLPGSGRHTTNEIREALVKVGRSLKN